MTPVQLYYWIEVYKINCKSANARHLDCLVSFYRHSPTPLHSVSPPQLGGWERKCDQRPQCSQIILVLANIMLFFRRRRRKKNLDKKCSKTRINTASTFPGWNILLLKLYMELVMLHLYSSVNAICIKLWTVLMSFFCFNKNESSRFLIM